MIDKLYEQISHIVLMFRTQDCNIYLVEIFQGRIYRQNAMAKYLKIIISLWISENFLRGCLT